MVAGNTMYILYLWLLKVVIWLVLVSDGRYSLWCVYDGRAPYALFVHTSRAPYLRNLTNIGNHVTVRLPICLHHRAANVKCQTYKLVWEPVICV